MASGELDTFCRFCGNLLTTEDGRPLVVEDWQRRFLADHFAGRREVAVIVAKKNGKSSTLGALALFHLLSVPEAEVVVLASSREQAGIILRQVQGYVRRSEPLRKRLVVKQREVENPGLGGRVRILSSDSATMDGVIPTLALVDELHRARTMEPYGLLRDGLGARDGRLVAISTAEGLEICPLGELRRAVYAQPGTVVDGPYRHVDTPNLSWHEWRLPDDADPDDLEAVAAANPASWITAQELEKRRTASMQEWQWKRFTCNIPSGQSGESAIPERAWRACAKEFVAIPAGAPGVYIGVDLALRQDCTALVPVAINPKSGLLVVHKPTILTPPVDGSLEVDDILGEMERMQDRWPECTFICDLSFGAELLAQRAEAELGARCVDHSQKHGPMCLAAERLATLVTEGKLRHPDDPELNAHVLAAVARQVGEQWRLAKPRGSDVKIDGAIALAMACSTALAPPKKKSGTVWIYR